MALLDEILNPLEVLPLALVVSTPDGTIRRANRYFEEAFGFSEDAIQGVQVHELGIWSDPDDRKEIIARLEEEDRVRAVETRFETASGESRDVEVSVGSIDQTREPLLIWAILDVTDRNRFRRQLEKRALYDPVTDLPNRTLLLDRLRGATKRAGTSGQPLAVLFVDLDDFKAVNDEYGHDVGDELLRRVGDRIEETVDPDETVARISADEFVVVLENTDREGAVAVGERLLDGFDDPFPIAGHTVPVDATLGIAVRSASNHRLETPEDLLRASDSAVYRARRSQSGGLHVFSAQDEDRLHRLHRKKRIRSAIANDELTLYFQPIIDLEEGPVVGAEVLVRWEHPEYGLVSASDFVPFAEEVGLITAIDRWVIERSVRQAADWAEKGIQVPRLQVNISGRTASRRDLLETIHDQLNQAALSADRIELEITERIAVQDTEILERLREEGIRLAIDDFGTGHSSLLSLRQLEADTLKLDRRFTADITDDPRTVAITRGVLSIAAELGVEVIGEGVETEEQRDRLAELGCTRVQGYLIARPLPRDEFEAFVRNASRTGG